MLMDVHSVCFVLHVYVIFNDDREYVPTSS